jgi:glycolate oxidase
VRVLELLEEESRIDLGLLGVQRFDELDGRYLHPAEPVMQPDLWSQYPLLTPDPESHAF